jgi:hypothetical protein
VAFLGLSLFGGAASGPALAAGPAAFDARLDQVFPTRVASRYFVFYSPLGRDLVERYAAFADAFVDLVQRDFFPVTETPFPVRLLVFPDRPAFQRYLRDELRVPDPPGFGMYFGELHLVATYHGAGLGTVTHEIMHPLVETSLPHREGWAHEGIPAFVEKFFGYQAAGRAEIVWGFHNPWRLRELDGRLLTLDLRTIVERSPNPSEQRLVAMFLFEHGKWTEFLARVKRNDRRGFGTFVEAAFGRRFAELEPAWREFLRQIVANRERLLRIPASTMFRTEPELRDFLNREGLRPWPPAP